MVPFSLSEHTYCTISSIRCRIYYNGLRIYKSHNKNFRLSQSKLLWFSRAHTHTQARMQQFATSNTFSISHLIIDFEFQFFEVFDWIRNLVVGWSKLQVCESMELDTKKTYKSLEPLCRHIIFPCACVCMCVCVCLCVCLFVCLCVCECLCVCVCVCLLVF